MLFRYRLEKIRLGRWGIPTSGTNLEQIVRSGAMLYIAFNDFGLFMQIIQLSLLCYHEYVKIYHDPPPLDKEYYYLLYINTNNERRKRSKIIFR